MLVLAFYTDSPTAEVPCPRKLPQKFAGSFLSVFYALLFETVESPIALQVNPLTPNIKEQIFLSCPHTFLIKLLGEVVKLSRKVTFDDHVLNSHNVRG